MRTTKNTRKVPKNAAPALPGAVVERYHRCGKSNCRCMHGQLHGPYYRRQWYSAGRLCTAYVRRRDLARVRAACAAYKQDRLFMREALRYSRMDARTLLALLREIEHGTAPS